MRSHTCPLQPAAKNRMSGAMLASRSVERGPHQHKHKKHCSHNKHRHHHNKLHANRHLRAQSRALCSFHPPPPPARLASPPPLLNRNSTPCDTRTCTRVRACARVHMLPCTVLTCAR